MRDPVRRMKLYEAIKLDIASGVYPPGSFLPNEFELADKYGYSRGTVRSTLTMLEDDKLVELLKGKGRRICPASVEKAQVPLTFLLPCADFISETFLDMSAQDARRMLKGFSQVAFEYDYRVETVPVSPSNNQHDIDWRKLDFVNKASRIVLAGYWYSDLFPLLLERGCRVAFVDPQVFCRKSHKNFVNSCFSITVNAFGAAEAGVEYLFRQNCNRIALFFHHLSEPEHPTMNGYLSGINKCGLRFSAWHELPEGQNSLQNIKNWLKDFYKKSGGFDGLLIEPNLVLYLRLHNIYQELELPDNVKIITFGDIESIHRMRPALTSMAFSYEGIGRIAARHLLANEFSPGKQLINARLIERESTLIFSEKTELVSV